MRTSRLTSSAGWAALALSVAVYAAVSIAMRQPFHAGGFRLRFFDLRIYHLGALRLMHGASLYGSPMLHGLGFTYPPFAALVLAPLAWVPLAVDEAAVTALNLALLVWALRRTLLLGAPGQRAPGLAPAWSQAAGIAAAALWLEPISVTLGYGQINLLITALVVFDLSRPDGARCKGAAIGVAAAVKLTPLLFIPYLLLSRRGRAAGVATATFAATIALGVLLAGRDTAVYWSRDVFDTARVGGALTPANQSLRGAIARFTGLAHPAGSFELLIVAVAGCGIALAVSASRRGDETAGFSLAALTGLLVSPVSWPHHWTLAVPALVLLARRAHERRSRGLGAAAVVLGLVGYAYLPELAENAFNSARGLASLPATDPYPLVAIFVLAAYAATRARTAVRPRRALTGVRLALRPPAAPAAAVRG